jgi:hypothetical protein
MLRGGDKFKLIRCSSKLVGLATREIEQLENRRRGLFGRVPGLGFVGVDKVDKWVAELAWRGEIGLRDWGVAMKSFLTEM